MFGEPIRSGLFEGNDILYDVDTDSSFYNDAYGCVENGAALIRSQHMGEGSLGPEYTQYQGLGIMDTIKALAPYAGKIIGTIGTHFLEKNKEKNKLDNLERIENRDFIKRAILQETDPARKQELIDRLKY